MKLIEKLKEPYQVTKFEWFATHLIILCVAIGTGVPIG